MDIDDREFNEEHGGGELDREFDVVSPKRDRTSLGNKRYTGKVAVIAIIFMALGLAAYFGKDKLAEAIGKISVSMPEFSGNDEEKAAIQIESGSKSTFVSYGEEYLYSTKDGVKYFDSVQNQKWNYTYTMSSPVTINNGNFTAVAEAQGRIIRVYNEAGEVYTVQPDGVIFQCSINKNGGMAVIVKAALGYKVLVYNETGQLLMERFEQDEGVYPIALDISEDNRILAISYLDSTGIEMASKMLLFYTNKEDNKNTDSGEFFASVEKTDSVIPVIKYMDNGVFAAVGDNIVFAMDSSGKEVWSIELTNEVDGVAFGQGKYIALAYGEEFAESEGPEEGTIEVINSAGKIVGDYNMGVPVSYIKAYDKGIVAGGSRKFVCLSYNVKAEWEYAATHDIRDIVLMDSSKSVLLVGNNTAEFMEME